MAIINPDGLFGGDRLRRCSNVAQLHWPRLFLASDGFGRLELNYARIIGRAYPTFNPFPSETDLFSWLQEFIENSLLFPYEVNGQLWGQWDTRPEFLPKYKTATDRRSPIPPEPAFTEWKKSYRAQIASLPKSFRKISERFLHGVGVGVGVGKNICASDDARVGVLPSIDNPPFETTEPDALFPVEPAKLVTPGATKGISERQATWFGVWWESYWLHKAKKAARDAFGRCVRTEARFERVMAATKAQNPEMLQREPGKRPHGATWLKGERWEDEPDAAAKAPRVAADDYEQFPHQPELSA